MMETTDQTTERIFTMHSSKIRTMTIDTAVAPAKRFVELLPVQDADVLDVSHQPLEITLKNSSGAYLTALTDRYSRRIVFFAVTAVDNGTEFRSATNPWAQPMPPRKRHESPPWTPLTKGRVERAFHRLALEHQKNARLRSGKPASRLPKGDNNAA
jgi:hypothetical protein